MSAERPVTRVALVETSAPLESFDFSTADRWELLVLDDGEPSARVSFPSPGPIDSARLARELIHPHTETRRRGRELSERLLRRLDAPPPPRREPPPCSVVLCTHGRPAHLPAALESLAGLEPEPLEVIVVDNAPGDRDCRGEVLSRGFRYLREDRQGLDNARNAGVRAAAGEVIAFTDDDCVHPPGWLAHLAQSFDDPMVAAVTGPAFPYRLDTPARVRMERQASLARGLGRRTFDWTLLSALHAGRAGVGANMAIRADLLDIVGAPFPPELDAGTETRSGGDTYVFARLLAAGHRISYEPRAYVFHQHRADWTALEEAVRGYGVGASAALTKLLVEDGELEAPKAALWLLSQYLRTQGRRARGRADAVETRIAWAYLRGGMAGPTAWRRALRRQRALDPALVAAPPFPAPTAGPAETRRRPRPAPPRDTLSRSAAALAISVIVPSAGREGSLRRCLVALAAQRLPAGAFEVIVVDDSRGSDLALPGPLDPAVRLHRTGGRGAAVARNEGAACARGGLLLFLDDDLVATPELLRSHLARHARETNPASPAVVIGYSPPAPPRPGLAALGAALWWEDQFGLMERAAELSFTEALSGNVSIERAAFLDGRRFEPAFAGLRREDWEWGLRLLNGGARLLYEPAAVAAHEYRLEAGARLRACRLEGAGDALLVERHPEAAASLPLARHRPPTRREPARRLAFEVLGRPAAEPCVRALLDGLERLRLRTLWSAFYGRAQRAAYIYGARAGGWHPAPGREPPTLEVELGLEAAPPRAGTVAPRLRLTNRGHRIAELAPGRCWQPGLEAELAEQLDGAAHVNGRAHHVELGTSVTVILREARHATELEASGAQVAMLSPERANWTAVLDAAGRAETELIAIALPGRAPEPSWLAEVEPAFEAPRVSLAVGRALPFSRAAEPIVLHERRSGRLPFAPLGGPADYVVLRRSALDVLRAAVARAARYGHMAVAFACVENVLDAGGLVAQRNAHGLAATVPDIDDAADRERAKLRAWAALLAAHALEGPPQRLVWLGGATAAGLALRSVRGRPASLGTAATARALLDGYGAALRRADPQDTPW